MKSYLLKRHEGGPGHGGETGVDLVSESYLLKRHESGPDGLTGVILVSENLLT